MERITEHVWWMPPGPPDRPSLCAVVGERWTLALDAGSSRAHTRAFLDGLPAKPDAVVYTHSHWDHVFGGVEIGGLVVAQRGTAEKLRELAARDWNDDASVNDHIRAELPAPRTVEIAQADVVFGDRIDLHLGGVDVRVEWVESDHCDDACIAFVSPDQLLFVGDALCAGADGRMTDVTLRLFDRLLETDIRHYVEGHHPVVTSRSEFEALAAKAHAAAQGRVTPGDEDSEFFGEAFSTSRR
jgi:glyoxylase-like metal-dependent hydrolase (beta-lactamase superfamily II)